MALQTGKLTFEADVAEGTFYFEDGPCIVDATLKCYQSATEGYGGNFNWWNYNERVLNGTSVCDGITYYVNINETQWISTPGIPPGGFPMPGEHSITLTFVGTTYEPPNPPPNPSAPSPPPTPDPENPTEPAPDTSPDEPTPNSSPTATLEWVEQVTVRQEGINEECFNDYDITTLKNGEIKAQEPITNSFIPSVEMARRIGRLANFLSEKDHSVGIPTVFNKSMICPGETFEFDLSKQNRFGVLERAVGFDFASSYDDQSVKVKFEVRK